MLNNKIEKKAKKIASLLRPLPVKERERVVKSVCILLEIDLERDQ